MKFKSRAIRPGTYTKTKLLGDLDQTGSGALTGCALGLVDLGEHGVGGLRNESGSETGDETGTKVDGGLGTRGGSGFVDALVDGLGDLLVNDELGHGVGDPESRIRMRVKGTVTRMNLLLEEHGTEARVETVDTLGLCDLGETRNETGSEGGLRDETNAGGLEGAQGNVGEELGKGGRNEVDGGAVLDSGLVADHGDGLLLEEFVTTELEGTLEEVTSKGRADTGQESASTLVLDDLAETANETAVVGDGVELDSGLDAVWGLWSAIGLVNWPGGARRTCASASDGWRLLHIDGGETTVGDGTADGTGKGESRVEVETAELLGSGSLDVLLDGVHLGGAGRGRRGSSGGRHCSRG
jgi:hypothetical protein